MKLQTELKINFRGKKIYVIYDYSPNSPIFPECVSEHDVGFVRVVGKVSEKVNVYIVDVFIKGKWVKRNPLYSIPFYAVEPFEVLEIQDPIQYGKKVSDYRKHMIPFKEPILLTGKWKYRVISEKFFREKMRDRNKTIIYVTYTKASNIQGNLQLMREFNFINSNNVSIVTIGNNGEVVTGNAVIGEIVDNPHNIYLVEKDTYMYLKKKGVKNICRLNEKDRIANREGKIVYGSMICNHIELKRKMRQKDTKK